MSPSAPLFSRPRSLALRASYNDVKTALFLFQKSFRYTVDKFVDRFITERNRALVN